MIRRTCFCHLLRTIIVVLETSVVVFKSKLNVIWDTPIQYVYIIVYNTIKWGDLTDILAKIKAPLDTVNRAFVFKI